MTISQLIGQLLAILAAHGDLEVTTWVPSADTYHTISTPEVGHVAYYSDTKECRIGA